MRLRHAKPGHVALCMLILGLGIGLAVAGFGSWLVPVFLVVCMLAMVLLMRSMT